MDPLKYQPHGVLIANCSYQQHGESTQYSTTPSCLHTKKPLPMAPTTFVPLLKLLVKKTTITKLRQSCNLNKLRIVKESSILSNGRATQILTIPGNQPLT